MSESEQEGVELPAFNPGEPRGRVTLAQTLYYRPAGEEAMSEEFRQGWDVEGDEQPYIRRCKATEEWKPLDLGWFRPEAAGLILIANEAGRRIQLNQSEEEQEELRGQIIEVAYGPDPSADDAWLVYPGRSFHGHPSRPGGLFVRAQTGTIRYNVYVYPR